MEIRKRNHKLQKNNCKFNYFQVDVFSQTRPTKQSDLIKVSQNEYFLTDCAISRTNFHIFTRISFSVMQLLKLIQSAVQT